MGGAYGHAQHVWEDSTLTFGELKELLAKIAAADLEDMAEKTDGQNMFITWRNGHLYMARNKGDLATGGVPATEVVARFEGRGTVYDAFKKGAEVSTAAIKGLPNKVRQQCFRNGTIWYSIEIMHPANRNVIDYDVAAIAFHRFANRVFDEKGNPVDAPWAQEAFEVLMGNIERMQRAAEKTSWRVYGPIIDRLQAIADDSHVERALGIVDAAMAREGMSDSDAIGDMRVAAAWKSLSASMPDLTPKLTHELSLRAATGTGISLRDASKGLAPAAAKRIKPALEEASRAAEESVMPIEGAVTSLAIELMRGLKSVFITDNSKETARLQGELDAALRGIEASGNVKAQEIAARQMARLPGGLKDVASAAEGIMFRFKGRVFKLTGAYAALNAILGLFKFGRGKAIPPLKKEGSVRHHHAIARSIVRHHLALLTRT